MDVTGEQATSSGPSLACPTCGARQAWSDECRRCGSDLSDLRAVWLAGLRAKAGCRIALRAGKFDQALVRARRLASLDPSESSRQLLTVCLLLCGDWSEALLASQTPTQF